MTERAKTWLLNPSLVIQILGLLMAIGSTWAVTGYRLTQIESRSQSFEVSMQKQISDLRGEIREMRATQLDVERASVRMEAIAARVASLEADAKTQVQINSKLAAQIARLER